MSSLLRRTPRTVPQFAKGSKFILELLKRLVELMDPDDPRSDVVERFECMIRGLRTTTVAGQEAIEQVESAVRKKRDEQLVKELAKNYQSRKGGLMTAKAGREMWDAREVSEQSAQQRKAAKLAQKAEDQEAEQAIRAAEEERQAAEAARQARRTQATELIDMLDGLDDLEFTDWASHQRDVEAWEPDYGYDNYQDEDENRYDDYQEDQHHHDSDLDADGEIDVFSSSPPPRQIDPAVQAFNDSIEAAGEAHKRRHELHHGITRASDWGMDV
jgi:hypothetical protein